MKSNKIRNFSSTYYVLGIVFDFSHIHLYILHNCSERCYYGLYFIDEETEAKKVKSVSEVHTASH
jgi:hypothetical protein